MGPHQRIHRLISYAGCEVGDRGSEIRHGEKLKLKHRMSDTASINVDYVPDITLVIRKVVFSNSFKKIQIIILSYNVSYPMHPFHNNSS